MLSVYKNGIIAVMFTLRKIGKLLFRCAIHVLFWIVVYFFYNYFLGYGSENTEYVTRFSLFLIPATVVVSYVFLLYLIPKYLLHFKIEKNVIFEHNITHYIKVLTQVLSNI